MRRTPEPRLGFPFTPADSPAVRARVGADLSRIVRAAHADDANLRALVLTGSFSRGEGGVRNGLPLNDYDLLAIRAVPGAARRYRRLGARLTREIGVEVDLAPVWIARLPCVGRKLFWLDVALGARVVSGDPGALRRLRRFEATRLPHAEIARLLGNRAAGLLLALPGRGEPADPLQRDLQAAKAILAAMDAALLASGRYAPRLRDRLELARGHPDHALFALAVTWKLCPEGELACDAWTRARDALLRAVDATRARDARDGPAEWAHHLLAARRITRLPSQAVRLAAWDLLAASSWPDGPIDAHAAASLLRRRCSTRSAHDWTSLKRAFFLARARTLQ